MLSKHMLQEQTFENLIQEARAQIPLYTSEWTNFNSSDPAETILENLSAFTILQQAYIDRMPEEVQQKMFAMAGFVPKNGRSARVLLEAKHVKEPVMIPSGQRFSVGEMCFETNREFQLRGNRLIGIYSKYKDVLRDYSYILDEDYPIDAYVFTEQPQEGMKIYLVMDEIAEEGEEIIFYVRLSDEYKRNAFEGKNHFAEIQWQIYTAKGFVNIRCKDGSASLLTSGELAFRIPKEAPVIYEKLPEKGYVIRGVLKRAEYDIPPKIVSIHGFLFEVWQKETKSICYTYEWNEAIEICCDILEEGYIQVFCKETQDGSYYLYDQAGADSQKGRYYRLQRLGFGKYRIAFDQEAFGYMPGHFPNAVKIVSYNQEMMYGYDLGVVYGYDNQEITLPEKHMVKENFSIIVMHKNDKGEQIYDFVRPSSKKNGELQYTLMENDGILVITDAADYIDARIFLGGCAVSNGDQGNIRAGSRFLRNGYDSEIVFTNPVVGKGGCYTETITQVRQRFIEDLREHYTAVDAQDYEQLVRTTPMLCIDKVKAVRDTVKNQVKVAVKPLSSEQFPRLNEIYKQAILERLEQARLLTVHIEIEQPVYVPVYVRGTIYIKPHYTGCKEQIEEVIRRELNYISTNRNFGEIFHFDTLFHLIEELSCVNYIYELSVTAQNSMHVVQKGLDMYPKDNCLLYPEEIILELNTTE